MSGPPVILLFRRDLRLSGNPALAAALDAGAPVIPLFVLDDEDPYPFGAAGKWWLHRSLEALGEKLRTVGSDLVLRRSKTVEAVLDVAQLSGAAHVFAGRRHLQEQSDSDLRLETRLAEEGVELRTFSGALLREPEDMRAASTGRPYQVFSPFFRALSWLGPTSGAAGSLPARIPRPAAMPPSARLEELRLLPTRPNWARGFDEIWTPGEDGARAALDAFLDGPASTYAERRDRPAARATSRLSPHLAFGEISPALAWRAVQAQAESGRLSPGQAEKFLSELAWREFSNHLLAAFPRMAVEPLRAEFAGIPWSDDDGAYRAWTKGLTGYPIVDAGMRQLWRAGWMHNRVRMIAASFLVKDLLISWRRGEAWFQNTLVDYDPASNIANWQWVAGSGADAAPYFRIFNPTLQGEKFDPDGAYVKAFVPELAKLPAKYVHRPFEAPAETLARAGVRLGVTYPRPIVDHAKARIAALDALKSRRGAAGKPAERGLFPK